LSLRSDEGWTSLPLHSSLEAIIAGEKIKENHFFGEIYGFKKRAKKRKTPQSGVFL